MHLLFLCLLAFVFGDDGGTGFFRPDDVRGYRCYEKTCVAGSNYKIIEDADYRVCAEACNEEEKCLGFEIYHNWGGRKTKFKQGDCILNSANRKKNCRAYNLNWCVKHDLILAEVVEYYDFADGLCPSESHLTHEECQRVANEKAIDGGWDEYYDFEAINKADKPHGCHKSENDETYGEGAPSFTIFYNSNKGISKRKDKWEAKPFCKFVKSEFTCEGEQPGCENCLYHHQRTGNDQCRICNGGYLLNDNHKCEKIDVMDHCPNTYTADRWNNWICRNWNKKPVDCIKGVLGQPIQQTTSYRGYCKPEFGYLCLDDPYHKMSGKCAELVAKGCKTEISDNILVEDICYKSCENCGKFPEALRENSCQVNTKLEDYCVCGYDSTCESDQYCIDSKCQAIPRCTYHVAATEICRCGVEKMKVDWKTEVSTIQICSSGQYCYNYDKDNSCHEKAIDIMEECPKGYYVDDHECYNDKYEGNKGGEHPWACFRNGDEKEIMYSKRWRPYRDYCKPEMGDDEAAIGSLVGEIENYLPSFNFFIILVFCVIAGYGIAIYRSRKEENNYQILNGDNKRIELVEAQE